MNLTKQMLCGALLGSALSLECTASQEMANERCTICCLPQNASIVKYSAPRTYVNIQNSECTASQGLADECRALRLQPGSASIVEHDETMRWYLDIPYNRASSCRVSAPAYAEFGNHALDRARTFDCAETGGASRANDWDINITGFKFVPNSYDTYAFSFDDADIRSSLIASDIHHSSAFYTSESVYEGVFQNQVAHSAPPGPRFSRQNIYTTPRYAGDAGCISKVRPAWNSSPAKSGLFTRNPSDKDPLSEAVKQSTRKTKKILKKQSDNGPTLVDIERSYFASFEIDFSQHIRRLSLECIFEPTWNSSPAKPGLFTRKPSDKHPLSEAVKQSTSRK